MTASSVAIMNSGRIRKGETSVTTIVVVLILRDKLARLNAKK